MSGSPAKEYRVTALDYFEYHNTRGTFRPVGAVSLAEAVQLVTAALVLARERGVQNLLVDLTGLTGFAPPTLSERFFLVTEWANAAGGAVRMAVAVAAEMIDPNKFGVTVAANRGMASNVFASVAEAVAWLDGTE